MNINSYRKLTGATRAKLDTQLLDSIHCVLGLISELLHEYAKATTPANEREELGDANWFAAEYCNIWGIETPDKFHIHPDIGLDVTQLTSLLGELADLDKDALVYGREQPLSERRRVILLIWQIIETLTIGAGYDSEETREINLKKLIKRFGDRFSVHAANNRDLQAELEILSQGL